MQGLGADADLDVTVAVGVENLLLRTYEFDRRGKSLFGPFSDDKLVNGERNERDERQRHIDELLRQE